jgi:hypothetical protein
VQLLYAAKVGYWGWSYTYWLLYYPIPIGWCILKKIAILNGFENLKWELYVVLVAIK